MPAPWLLSVLGWGPTSDGPTLRMGAGVKGAAENAEGPRFGQSEVEVDKECALEPKGDSLFTPAGVSDQAAQCLCLPYTPGML